MKVCHIIFSLETGGTEAMLVDILNEQVKGCTVSLIIINNRINEKIVQCLDSRVNLIKLGRKPQSRNVFFLVVINILLYSIKPDIIHFHQHNGINLLLPVFRKKAVLTVHGIRVESDSFSKYKKLFSVSDSVKQDIFNRYQLSSQRIYNGIDTSRINAKGTTDNSHRFRIVQVSRLDHDKKGQHILLESIYKLIYKYNILDVYLDLIGEGPSREHLEKLAEKLKIKEHIQFLGEKDRQYIYSNLQRYDLLVQPSLNEGFGLTVAEGMAAKIPVLVSDIEGPMEIIKNGEYGYYFRSGDSDNCADKIMQIMTNDNFSQINKAYDYCVQNFKISFTVSNYQKEYTNV